MARAGSIFAKIGGVMKAKPKPAEAKPPKATTPGAKKGFDFGLYMKAVGMAFNDFFGKKLPYFFKNIGPVMKNFPNWWKKLPQDEQISYGVLLLGNLMVIMGIVLVIIL
jgi:hypothetical protein